jgi:hypothetical protein
LTPTTQDFKEQTVRRDLPLTEAGARFADPSRFVDAEFEFRLFLCGSCGTLLETEVAASSDDPLPGATLVLASRLEPLTGRNTV